VDRAALQPEGVEADVEHQPGERQRRGEPVGRKAEHDRARGTERDTEGEGPSGGDPPGDDRPALGAAHPAVDVTVDELVDDVRATRRQVTADGGPEHEHERRHSALGDEHRQRRGDQKKRDDPRLGEPDVIADRARKAPDGVGIDGPRRHANTA
jgi:hypothetical protein